MTHGNRRLDIVLALGLAALVLVPWYRIESGFLALAGYRIFRHHRRSRPAFSR